MRSRHAIGERALVIDRAGDFEHLMWHRAAVIAGAAR